MKPSRNRLIVLLLGTALTASAGMAVAQDRSHGDHPRGERLLERMSQRLDLDETQRAEIEAILEQSRPAMREQYREMRRNQRELRRLMRDDDADIEAIRSLAVLQGELTTGLIIERAEMTRAIRNMLTPEQQAKAERMMQRRGKHRHHRQRGVH